MARFTRGFAGRGRAGARRASPARPIRHRQELAGAHRRGHAPARHRDVDVPDRGARRPPDHVDLGRDPRAPAVDLLRRHPLRHDVVEVRHALHAACRSTRCSTPPACNRPRRTCSRSRTPAYTTNLPLADVHERAGVGRVGLRGPARSSPRTAARPGCSCRTSTSGRARSSSPACASSITTNPGSGSRTATTIAATRGSSSATRATDGRDDAAAAAAHDRRGRRRRSSRSGPRRARAKTFRLALPEPARHRAGQHCVVRLTAPDGYTASRSYSIASAPDDSNEFELTVERLEGGEVSTFLHDEVAVGDELEVRGPIGGWFVWDGDVARAARRRWFGRRAADGDAPARPRHRPRRISCASSCRCARPTTSTTPTRSPARRRRSSTRAPRRRRSRARPDG